MLNSLKGIGTAAGIAGGMMVAMRTPISGWGYLLLAVSSGLWACASLLMREKSLTLLQVVFTAINAIGIWRWLVDT